MIAIASAEHKCPVAGKRDFRNSPGSLCDLFAIPSFPRYPHVSGE